MCPCPRWTLHVAGRRPSGTICDHRDGAPSPSFALRLVLSLLPCSCSAPACFACLVSGIGHWAQSTSLCTRDSQFRTGNVAQSAFPVAYPPTRPPAHARPPAACFLLNCVRIMRCSMHTIVCRSLVERVGSIYRPLARPLGRSVGRSVGQSCVVCRHASLQELFYHQTAYNYGTPL